MEQSGLFILLYLTGVPNTGLDYVLDLHFKIKKKIFFSALHP